MQSLLRVEDWAPVIQYQQNPYWAELMRIIEEFEQLVETQKKQIVQCVRSLTIKRIELIKAFYNHKTSLLFQNQLKKQQITIYDNQIARQFFIGYYSVIDEIVRKVGENPRSFAQIISSADGHKKLESLDFAQNIIYNLYPCYLPSQIQIGEQNNCLSFIEELINQWDYSIDFGRPKHYTIVDQILNGINKAPQIVCYVEKISIQFMKQLNKCKMDIFAFDQEALKHEMEVKKNLTASYDVQKKSRWQKVRSFFGKDNQKASGYYSQTSEVMDPNDIQFDLGQIMKVRQQNFLNVVKRTIDAILNQPTPYLLNQMMRFFNNKLRKMLPEREISLTTKESLSVISQQSINQSVIMQSADLPPDSFKRKTSVQPDNNSKYYRHYCYFIMTNLIFEELHNKFTSKNWILQEVSHEDSGMTPADLQNITQIIRIMSNLFQGLLPEGGKYKNQKNMVDLQFYLGQIPKFYNRILERAEIQSKSSTDMKREINGDGKNKKSNIKFNLQIREILLHLHQNNLILSFNDIRCILDILSVSKKTSLLKLSSKSSDFSFLKGQKYNQLYSSNSKRVEFNGKKHEVDKILFVFNSVRPSINQVVEYYTGKQSPLKNLPVLTKALMYNSNLQVSEALQINKALSLIQNLSLRQIKYYLNKISIRYNSLYLKNSEEIAGTFRQTISQHLNSNIQRKATLLMYRQQLLNRIISNQKLIIYYCDSLQSSQLYDRISEAFIHNIKIKIYMRIENDEFKVYTAINNIKGVQLKSILMSDSDHKTKNFSEDYLLRNSFKNYTNIKEVLHSITRNSITRSALHQGRRVEEFNNAFNQICDIIISYIEQFMKKRQIFQNLNKEKLGKLIISKLQDQIYLKSQGDNMLTQDVSLKAMKNKINRELFFKKDLQQLQVDWDFLVQQGCKKFQIISKAQSINDKLRHFEELFRIVFTIVGFSIPNNKISAQIINPIIQYLILVSKTNKHYECLYALQCLKYGSTPEAAYNLILYQSSLMYVNEMMEKDYPLDKKEK